MKRILAILIVTLIASQAVFAGFISAKDLAKLSKADDIVIVSARTPEDYASKHVKGSVNIDHKALYKADGIKSMLKSPEEIAAVLGAKGISENSKIYIYDSGSCKAAGRLYWILKYMGATDVNILDGHIKAWMKARKPVTSKATEVTVATFTPAVNENIYASMDYVKGKLDDAGVLLVDVRSQDEFNGIDEDENISRKGHIPGAVSFEFKQILDDDGALKSKEDITAVLTAAGITADKEIVLYCASSVRAGIVFAALTDVMEFPNVKVYDGAFYQWNSFTANPVE